MIIGFVEGGRSEQKAVKKGGRFQGWCGMQKEESAVGYKPIYILTDSMEPVIPAGSWVVGVPACGEKIAVGDVAAYRRENGTKLQPTIIHRVVGITESGFIFQGDNNELSDSQIVRADQIIYRIIYPDVSQD